MIDKISCGKGGPSDIFEVIGKTSENKDYE